MQTINVAFVGHVDHGKSSILGRLLVDTGSLPEGKLEQLKTFCQTHSKDFEYAYLIDSLEKEQSQGITIDAARYFIRSGSSKFLFIDTPGHLDFLKNMITGSSSADIALLIIDALEGILENTLRHLFLLSFLEIPKVFILINKMDRVGYRESVFIKISEEIKKAFDSHQLGLPEILPISAKNGDNFMVRSENIPWYRGKTLWEALSSYVPAQKSEESHFRMPLQDIYRFSKEGDERRIYSGTVSAGRLRKGDMLLFSPSEKVGVVDSIESDSAHAGFAIGFTLKEPIFVERGEVISDQSGPAPFVSDRFRVRLFWLGAEPLVKGEKYTFRLHTAKVSCRIEEIHAVYDSASLEKKRGEARQYDLIECTLCTQKMVGLDTHRFVLGGSKGMVSAGMIVECLKSTSANEKKGQVVVFLESEADLRFEFEKKLLSRGDLVYTIVLKEESEERVRGMLKVCRDLGVTCLLEVFSKEDSKRFL